MTDFKTQKLYTITKKDLCTATNKNSRWIEKNIFRDMELLQLLGIDKNGFKKIREFNHKQTKVLIDYLGLRIAETE